LEEQQLQVVSYLPVNAFLVKGSDESVERLALDADIAATAAAVARTTHPKAEGIDLVGKIDDGVRLEDRSLFWRNGPNLTVRHGRWKLIVYRVGGIERVQLFDLSADPDECDDLASDPGNATRIAALRVRLKTWQEETGDRWFGPVRSMIS
jgi:arylsulfatase A-like enzyme